MSISDLINSRTSANSYDTSRDLSEADISELIFLATRAPTAFNFQNWKFIAVRSKEAKARLLPLAFDQQKVVDAAVTFIICGTLEPHTTLPASLLPTFETGIIDEATYNAWIVAAQGNYQNNQVLQRDEAIRSGSLAAMTLMLAAKGKGLVSAPMIGFDPVGVSEAFGLAATEVPVMLVTVGYPGPANWPQKPRKPVQDVLSFV
ncbi:MULTISPECIES: nitroreductase family protein [Gammaproteobacteria]|uniref:nitroreductase family protein n=1 Tax=Gammaproteobacteria TaxID=1236 RepID=UPI001128373D|nr:nitroreductase family protein [Pseudomonas sp. Hp2]